MVNEVHFLSTTESFSPTFIPQIWESRSTGNMSLGASLNSGLQYEFANNLTLELGLQAVFQAYKPQRNDVVRYISGEEDMTSTLSPYQRSTIYKKELLIDNTAPPDTDEPAEELQVSHPFSSLGIQLAVYYRFE